MKFSLVFFCLFFPFFLCCVWNGSVICSVRVGEVLLCCNVVDSTMLSVKFEFECKSGPRSRYSKRLSRILDGE